MPVGASLDTPANRGQLMGAMMRRSLGAGEILTLNDLMRSGDHGFLAAVLGPGMCAVTVGVDAVSGTAGLIWPGDRVDVILTEAGGGSENGISALRVLNDVRVIAIDQQLVQGTAANSGSTTQPLARTVTLEVSADQAERIAVASRLGSLSLAVLSATTSPQAVQATDKTAVVWGTDISPAKPAEASSPPAPLTVHIWQGTNDAKAYSF
jgi:pilus assembly protein CpaB